MKKVVCFLMALLLMPVIANADVAMPIIKTFDVVVIKDSIPYYEDSDNLKESGTIPKGTELKVERRFIKDGVEYGQVEYGKNKWAWIKLEDVFASGELGKDAKDVKALDGDYRLFVDGEAIIRKGPISSYEKVATVKNKEFKAKYMFGDDFTTALYIENGDESGWIIFDENTYASANRYVVFKDFKNSDCGVVKKSDLLNVWSNSERKEFVRIDGKMCPLDEEDSNNLVYLTGKKTHIKMLGSAIFSKDNGKEVELKADDELVVYTDFKRFDGTEVAYYYGELNGDRGWLKVDTIDDVEELSSEPYELKDPKDPEPNKEKKKHKEEEKDTNVVLISCVVGAIAFVLGVLVTIIFVNRKKAKKEEIPVVVTTEEKEQKEEQ